MTTPTKHEEHESYRAESSAENKGEQRAKDPTKIRMELHPAGLIAGTIAFFKSLFSLRDIDYEVEAVIRSVKEGIVFKGYNIWILMCSILIASIGLNIDSTAVVIGAMLISPLMGPIKGVGFGVGINDFRLLLDALKNLGVTVGISLIVAFLYFSITPIRDTTLNLLGRTEPTFLDVLIALFGGLSGVIAHSQGKNDTVIPGVAIATALMPPLCTAGYGLASAQWGYFLGAFYLFLLNSLLIAASTYFFIRYLKFPKKQYLNPKVESRVRAYTLSFVIVVVTPSGYLFYKMTKRSIFESNASKFVKEVVMKTDENMAVTPVYEFDWKTSTIRLVVNNYYVNETIEEMWNLQKVNYQLDDAVIRIQQDLDFESLIDQKLTDYDQQNRGANTLVELISKREQQMILLNKKIELLESQLENTRDKLRPGEVLAGFKIDYPAYKNISIHRGYALNSQGQLDTIHFLSVEFKSEIPPLQRQQLNERLSNRFKLELDLKAGIKQDSIRILTHN